MSAEEGGRRCWPVAAEGVREASADLAMRQLLNGPTPSTLDWPPERDEPRQRRVVVHFLRRDVFGQKRRTDGIALLTINPVGLPAPLP
jgi:hypothetical protein